MARVARRRGWAVEVLAADSDPYSPRLPISVAVRAERLGEVPARVAWAIAERALQRSGRLYEDGEVQRARDVPSGLRSLTSRPRLLVANSLRAVDLCRVARQARSRRAPLAWFIRETSSLDHVRALAPAVDVLLANSAPLAEEVSRLSGRPCPFVPSYVDCSDLRPPSRPRSAIFVNPVPSHGLATVMALAPAVPEVGFVLQESWPLEAATFGELRRLASALPNVELRQRCPRAELFDDGLVLLAPFADEVALSRPRTALEAQFVGLPLVASDLPGLRSVAASVGLLVAPQAPISEWASTLRHAIAHHAEYSGHAQRFASAELADEDAIWEGFVDACRSVLGGSGPVGRAGAA